MYRLDLQEHLPCLGCWQKRMVVAIVEPVVVGEVFAQGADVASTSMLISPMAAVLLDGYLCTDDGFSFLRITVHWPIRCGGWGSQRVLCRCSIGLQVWSCHVVVLDLRLKADFISILEDLSTGMGCDNNGGVLLKANGFF